ncbi:hypothetical protein [Sporosarcina newyorkensis]|uniref:hypothetical protein n=1 Tax=Sporosarcina newyorkensis TaxID=759851 RepID=UPI003D01CFFE
MIPNKNGAIIINPTPSVRVIKRKNGKPTVIEYDGHRFIQEQQPRGKKVKPKHET